MNTWKILSGIVRVLLLLFIFYPDIRADLEPTNQYVYKNTADRPLKIYLTYPENWSQSDSRAVLIFFHNGGWKPETVNRQFEEQAKYFSARGMVVARADYREKDKSGVTSEKCMEDIFSAARWLRANAETLGIDPSRIAAGGGSGSGHLAASVFYVDEIRAPGDDPSISPQLSALMLFNPDLDVLEPRIMQRMLGGDPEHAKQMPPTLAFYGTRDVSHTLIADFVARSQNLSLPVEAFVGEDALHGFFKFSPWLEKTTLRADAFLQSAGLLEPQPRVKPPSKAKAKGYDRNVEENMVRWQARHEVLMKARLEKGNSAAATDAVMTGESARETDRRNSSDSVRIETRVYKTIGERKLIIEINYPDGWMAKDKRPAAVIFHGNANNPKDKAGNMYPMAEERARLGMPVAKSSVGEAFKPLAQYLAMRGLVTIRADFRTRPKDGVLTDKCIEDAISAMRWVRKNAAALGIDPDRIVSVGGSGGGNLAAGVATIDEFQSPDEDRSISPKPNAMLLYYPLLDWLAEHSKSEAFIEVLEGDREFGKRISPAWHWHRDLPPTLILVGTRDPMFESLKKFVALWKERGANIDIYIGEGGNHGFSQYSPWLEKTTERADEFLRSIGYLKDEPHVELPHRDKAEKLKKKNNSSHGQSQNGTDSLSFQIEQLKSDDTTLRKDAAIAILTAGDSARLAWPELVSALVDDERLDCAVAGRVLFAGTPTKNNVPALIKSLKSDTKARTAAAWELSRLGPAVAEAAPALIEALASEDKHARNFAVLALAMVGPPPEAVPALIKVTKNAGALDPPQMNYRYARASVALALGLMGGRAKEAVPALADLLKDEAESWEYHRAVAAFALGEIGPEAKEAAPAVTRVLKDPSPVVRLWAARALGKIAPESSDTRLEESVGVLVKALSLDTGRPTRDSVRKGLGALATSDAAWRPVSKGARKKALPVHESIAMAVGYLDSLPNSPMPGEIDRQQGKHTKDVVHYLLALGGIQQGIVPAMLEALSDEDRATRRSAAKALGRIGKSDEEAVCALEKALSDEDWMVHGAAAQALYSIGRDKSIKDSGL